MAAQDVYAAITVYHEARGEPLEGQVAVAQVIFNRVLRRQQSVHEVVFAPKQFSCYNDGCPPIINYRAYVRAEHAVRTALAQRKVGNSLYGADHYLNEKVVIRKYGRLPGWVGKMDKITVIGNHTFYKSK